MVGAAVGKKGIGRTKPPEDHTGILNRLPIGAHPSARALLLDPAFSGITVTMKRTGVAVLSIAMSLFFGAVSAWADCAECRDANDMPCPSGAVVCFTNQADSSRSNPDFGCSGSLNGGSPFTCGTGTFISDSRERAPKWFWGLYFDRASTNLEQRSCPDTARKASFSCKGTGEVLQKTEESSALGSSILRCGPDQSPPGKRRTPVRAGIGA